MYKKLFSFNQVDLQNMMDPEKVKRPHQSKFVKQFFYYNIVVILQIRQVKIQNIVISCKISLLA